MNLKPFDLERALAGDSVVTRDGRKILEIHLIKLDIPQPVIAVIKLKDEEDNFMITETFSLTGKYYNDEDEAAEDLFMAPKTKKLWIAVDKVRAFDGIRDTSSAYESVESLLDCGEGYSDNKRYIIKEIEIEV